MNILERILIKIRYGLIIQEALDRFGKFGIKISPYLLYVENDSTNIPRLDAAIFEDYQVSLLRSEDMKTIAAIPGRIVPEEQLLQRLKDGHLCVGIKHQGELVAFSWCNFTEGGFYAKKFPLKENEAYLYDAFTLRSFRGKNLAPFMRYQCYKELEKLGKNRLYSISEFFNISAKNFKKTLNAKPLELCIGIELFNKWNFHSRIKNYNS